MKQIRYLTEAAVVFFFINLFRILPLDWASAIGGFVGEIFGALSRANEKAMQNLRHALPGKSNDEYKKIIKGMWNNLGRVFAEYPHLEEIAEKRIEAHGKENLVSLIGTQNPGILFTGHLANWEVSAAYAYTQGVTMDLIYRRPNNKWVDGLLQSCRSMDEKLRTYPKSSQGMRDVFSALKEGGRIGILIDQKYNQGIAVPFFGRTAMTSPAFVQLAQRFECALLPGHVERLKGANFRITIKPPMDIKDRPLTDIIIDAHKMLEEWITKRPEQWLWIHRRWKDDQA